MFIVHTTLFPPVWRRRSHGQCNLEQRSRLRPGKNDVQQIQVCCVLRHHCPSIVLSRFTSTSLFYRLYAQFPFIFHLPRDCDGSWEDYCLWLCGRRCGSILPRVQPCLPYLLRHEGWKLLNFNFPKLYSQEGACSEQSSRMTAMDNSSKNAGEMIDKLRITFNRTRQAVITGELIEIISGAAAL